MPVIRYARQHTIDEAIRRTEAEIADPLGVWGARNISDVIACSGTCGGTGWTLHSIKIEAEARLVMLRGVRAMA